MATKSANLGNGKMVIKSGNLPDARMGKADKIQGGGSGKNTRAIAHVHNTIGGTVHAVSHNYGSDGAKGRQMGSHLGAEDE
jgi:hypothetical protein